MTSRIPAALLAVSLSLGALPALQAAEAEKAPAQPSAKEQAEIEARLKDARTRLEAAARDVAELSGRLHQSTMSFDVVMPRMQQRAMLGVGISRNDDRQSGGVVVESVTPGGAADKAGVRAGDILVSIDGRSLKDAKPSPNLALIQRLREVKAGDTVKLEYQRDGKKQTTEVTTEPAEFAAFSMRGGPTTRVFMGENMTGPRMVAPGMPAPPRAPDAPGRPEAPDVVINPFMHFGTFQGGEMLDLELVTLTPKLGEYFGADEGVLVVRSPKDSRFKLEEGDVIVDIDGREPRNGQHAMRILRSYQPGEEVTFNVLRKRKKVQIPVTLPKREGYRPIPPTASLNFNEGLIPDLTVAPFEVTEVTLEDGGAIVIPMPQIPEIVIREAT